ncbi:hypothetical protein FOZ63_012278 [Perkinsus olseni]|uniref:Uncharacterized protein n=1 Tax=Perkinsus olseni TaxID=32597 RepID=A0A7J6TT90_PEROL|nr:hypothetical protein FOZ63_012278 [Perkinsus olseni]KAF4747961.1 hypothetical protein FOZ62_012939 [Perkinsus olseni]
MYGRDPHTRHASTARERLETVEHVENVLNEKRAKSMLLKNETHQFKPDELVFVRSHAADRHYKVGQKWAAMKVLRQGHGKVYLYDFHNGRHRVIERHARECLPVPPGWNLTTWSPIGLVRDRSIKQYSTINHFLKKLSAMAKQTMLNKRSHIKNQKCRDLLVLVGK